MWLEAWQAFVGHRVTESASETTSMSDEPARKTIASFKPARPGARGAVRCWQCRRVVGWLMKAGQAGDRAPSIHRTCSRSCHRARHRCSQRRSVATKSGCRQATPQPYGCFRWCHRTQCLVVGELGGRLFETRRIHARPLLVQTMRAPRYPSPFTRLSESRFMPDTVHPYSNQPCATTSARNACAARLTSSA